MGSMFKEIMDFHLDIDTEFQGWVLVFATVTAIFLFCLPCYCAGLSSSTARRFASWLQQRLPVFYFCTLVVNVLFMAWVINALPDWNLQQYFMGLIKCTVGTLQHVLMCASSLSIIAAFVFAVYFKDRIAKLLGVDHKTLFRFKLRDLMTCFGPSRFKPIQLIVWKVEDLPSADPFAANNVFVEFFLGYNEPMRTRVHNHAGSGCTIKEHMQFNFDEGDTEEILYIFVRNQMIVGNSELARAEIAPEKLRRYLGNGWNGQFHPGAFTEPIPLIPRGTLYLTASSIEDEDGGFFQDMTTC